MPRSDIVRTLTTFGILTYVVWLIFLFRQVERLTRVTEQRFAGEWDQRIEVLSFVVLPPNTLLIFPPAVAAAAATWLAGPEQRLELAILLRIARWSANLMVGIAVLSAVATIFNDSGSPTRVGDLGLRIAGVLAALAASQLCRGAERSAPAG
jgi:hypothetical protein